MDNYIAFPKLGLNFNINPEIKITDSYSIKWYGVIICFAFVLAVLLGLRNCEKHGITKDDLLDYILFTVPFGIVGARLYYVIFSFDSYKDNLIDIVKIWEGGLAIYGGVIATVITVFIVSRVKKQSVIKILDFALPYIILGQAIGRWGNFTNQEAYGASTDLPWGMTGNVIERSYGDALVHPTFLYESLWCFIAFAVMMIFRKKLAGKGKMTAMYMILYGFERALVEGLRTDSLMLGNIRVSQWLSAILCIVGIGWLIYISRAEKRKSENEEVPEGDSLSRLIEEEKLTETAETIETDEH